MKHTFPERKATPIQPIHAATQWLQSVVAPSAQLTCDSRYVRPGDVFIAYPGARSDGRRYIPDAIAHEAGAILWDDAEDTASADDVLADSVSGDRFTWAHEWRVAQRPEAHLKQASGVIAADWYARPAQQLWSVGITGTSGKTSSALWLAQAFAALGKPCAMVGTLGIGILSQSATVTAQPLIETGLTTPDPVQLQRELRQLVDHGAQALAMEISSIGLVEGRVNGMRFDIALFTNLSRDHLDYHGDMSTYEAAKAELFCWDGLRTAVINRDDAAGPRMAALAHTHGADIVSYSIDEAQGTTANLYIGELSHDADGMRFNIHGCLPQFTGTRPFKTALIGRYNIANLLGVLAVLLASGVGIDEALAALEQLTPAPGRLERVPSRNTQAPMVLVDYAHKPDALEKVLSACRPLADARMGQLIVVFGCGGNRDAGKRPLMGTIAERLADRVIITSDNPRYEKSEDIIAAIVSGLMLPDSACIEADRGRAIEMALRHADARDVIVIAGKGHENYQEIDGVKQPFSDVEQATEVLECLP